MRTNLLMFAALICCILCTQSFITVSNLEISKPKEKIELKKRSSGLHSATTTVVEAYADDYMLTVSVENYTGEVYVQVSGANDALQTVFTAYNSGYEALDISSLPAGTCTVSITLDYAYIGTFVK